MDYKELYKIWRDNLDGEEKKELIEIENNEEEIKERFYKSLEFGTAGLRGILGLGENRMNTYIIKRATKALATYLKKELAGKELSVAIAYDSRNFSREFAFAAAKVLAFEGIKALIFSELKPVPMLSWTVRSKSCDAGIVVTASHNPAKYNGYKVYGEDGAQLGPEAAGIIQDEISKLDLFNIDELSLEEGIEKGLIQLLGEKEEEEYLDCVQAQSINPDLIKEKGADMVFVYTPFHGTGNVPVRKIFKRVGFENVVVVKEQEAPDGNFPTVESPNPENKEGFTIALRYAKECGADLIIGTDPDADRVGIIIKDKSGEYINLTGNQVGVLLTEYILSSKLQRGELKDGSFVVKTIVTTNIIEKICKAYGAEMKEVLTGFKYIGEKIKEAEETGVGEFVFGFEESYGYLKGTYARDKDAVVATMLIAEAALFYREKGLSLYDQLMKIYEKYGFYSENVVSVTLEGISGSEKIKEIMKNIRQNPPKMMAGKKVKAIRDYLSSERVEIETGTKEEILLPKSDVIYLELEDDNNFIVRPSGTEPKIKLYCLLCGKDKCEAESLTEKIKEDIDKLVNI